MAKNKDQNLVINTDGTAHDPNPEIKGMPSLNDLGIDATFIKETVRPLLKDMIVQGARDAMGLKKSELRKNSKAYNWSIFFKEIGWQLILMAFSVGMILVFFRVIWSMLTRWAWV